MELGIWPFDLATVVGEADERPGGREVEEAFGVDSTNNLGVEPVDDVLCRSRGSITSVVPALECQHHDGVAQVFW